VESKENLKTMIKIDGAKIMARDDEVKATGRRAQEFRASKERQIDKGIETKALITLLHPSATISYISILTFTIFICTFNNFYFDFLFIGSRSCGSPFSNIYHGRSQRLQAATSITTNSLNSGRHCSRSTCKP
jgi:hypothetical protein